MAPSVPEGWMREGAQKMIGIMGTRVYYDD